MIINFLNNIFMTNKDFYKRVGCVVIAVLAPMILMALVEFIGFALRSR